MLSTARILSTSLLLLAFGAQAPAAAQRSTQAHMHPAGPEYYAEMPQVQANRADWPQTTLAGWMGEPSMQASLAAGLKLDQATPSAIAALALQSMLGVDSANASALVGSLAQLESASISMSGAQKLGGALRDLKRSQEALATLLELDARIEEQIAQTGALPATLDELYLDQESAPVDPWGSPFHYVVHAANEEYAAGWYECRSLGPDQRLDSETWVDDLAAEDSLEATATHQLLGVLELQLVLQYTTEQAARAVADTLLEALSNEQQRAGDGFGLWIQEAPGWAWQKGSLLALGIGRGTAADFAARMAQPEGGAAAEVNAAFEHLGAAGEDGHLYLRGIDRLSYLGLAQQLLSTLGEQFLSQLPEPLIRWLNSARYKSEIFRTRQVGPRFASERLALDAPAKDAGEDWFEWWASSTAVPEALAARVSPEAVIVSGATIDGPALGRSVLGALAQVQGLELEAWLADFAEQHAGLRLDQELFEQIGPNAVLFVHPLRSLGVPETYAWVELRDPQRFAAALEQLATLLAGLLPEEFSLRTREYKQLPLTKLSMGEQSFVAPTFCVVDGALLVSGTEIHAKRAVKEWLEGVRVAQHPCFTSQGSWPEELRSYTFVDWAAVASSVWSVASGGLELLGSSMGGMQLPPMPTAEALSKHLSPMHSSRQRVEGGLLTHSSSCLGPDLPLALGLLGMAVRSTLEATVAEETQAAEDWDDEDESGWNAQLGMGQITGALYVYHTDTQTYPRALFELLEPSVNYPQGYLFGEPLPSDPWDHAFIYSLAPDGLSYTLHCAGPDGIDQSGAGDDIRFEG